MGDTEHRSDRSLGESLCLRGCPELHDVVVDVRCAGEGLHGRVVEVGHLVGHAGLDRRRARPDLLAELPPVFQSVHQLPFDGRVIKLGTPALPGRHDRDDRDPGMPERVGDHRDEITGVARCGALEVQDVDHAGQLSRFGVVHAHEAGAEHRAVQHGGLHRAGHVDVDAEQRRAVRLARDVQALGFGADQPPTPAWLGAGFGDGEHRSLGSEIAVGCGMLSAGHPAACCDTTPDGNAPAVRRCLDEHRPRRCACDRHRSPPPANAPAPGGELGLPNVRWMRVGNAVGCHLHPNRREVEVQLFGQDHRERRVHALPHLGGGYAQRDHTLRIDAHIRTEPLAVRTAIGRTLRVVLEEFGRDRECEPEEQAAGRTQDVAAREVDHGVLVGGGCGAMGWGISSAARRIAFLILA